MDGYLLEALFVLLLALSLTGCLALWIDGPPWRWRRKRP